MNQSEIAKKLGISQSSVSLVFRDPATSRVSAEKKELIIECLKGNPNANPSGHKRTWNIGYLTDSTQNINSGFFQESLRGIEEECARYHYNLMLECQRGRTVNLIQRSKVDGVVVRSGKVYESLLQSGNTLPAVLLNCSTDGLKYDVVMPDNRGGMFKIAAYLAERGISHCAFLGGNPEYSSYSCNYRERRSAFADGCNAFGLKLDCADIGSGADDIGSAVLDTVWQWTHSSAPPQAIVTANHFYAAVIRRAMPELPVFAGDNKMEEGFEDKSFPMLVQDGCAMGKMAVELLMRRITDPARKLVRLNCDMELFLPELSYMPELEQTR